MSFGDGKTDQEVLLLVAQQSIFDATRAPAGAHTLWAYTRYRTGEEELYELSANVFQIFVSFWY